ncbi:MAG: hypothetical protein LBI31_00405 [Zoogloeaceae bacterium]|jgi:hypothetical protein|nr:hypothetical protein [Zoogloeaceae bacterium]
MNDALNEAQTDLAQILAYHEAAGEIDRHQPGCAGFLACYEANLGAESREMLAAYEEMKRVARTELQRLLRGFAWATVDPDAAASGFTGEFI